MLTGRKLILITRKTRLAALKEKYCTLGQAKFYLGTLGEPFEQYLDEHERFEACKAAVVKTLSGVGRVQQLDREMLPTFVFNNQDIIIVLGQDGLVANTLKYLSGQPVVAVNPMPDLFDGTLLPFKPAELAGVITALLNQELKTKVIRFASVKTNLGESLLAVNDIFIGPKSHTSARYQLQHNRVTEEQCSSGVIVSTGLGSTGWFKSVICGASGIADAQVQSHLANGFGWSSPYLYYSVREPFPSSTTSCDQVFGKIEENDALVLTSRMPENGVIFSDGIENDALAFSAGTTATIRLSETLGHLVC